MSATTDIHCRDKDNVSAEAHAGQRGGFPVARHHWAGWWGGVRGFGRACVAGVWGASHAECRRTLLTVPSNVN